MGSSTLTFALCFTLAYVISMFGTGCFDLDLTFGDFCLVFGDFGDLAPVLEDRLFCGDDVGLLTAKRSRSDKIICTWPCMNVSSKYIISM